jgi:hypothetical protein
MLVIHFADYTYEAMLHQKESEVNKLLTVLKDS